MFVLHFKVWNYGDSIYLAKHLEDNKFCEAELPLSCLLFCKRDPESACVACQDNECV